MNLSIVPFVLGGLLALSAFVALFKDTQATLARKGAFIAIGLVLMMVSFRI